MIIKKVEEPDRVECKVLNRIVNNIMELMIFNFNLFDTYTFEKYANGALFAVATGQYMTAFQNAHCALLSSKEDTQYAMLDRHIIYLSEMLLNA